MDMQKIAENAFVDELEKLSAPAILQHDFPTSLEQAKAIKYLGRYFSPKHPLIQDLINSGNETQYMSKRLQKSGLIELQHDDILGKDKRSVFRHELAHYLRDKKSGFKGNKLYDNRLKRFKEEFIAEYAATKRSPEYKNTIKRLSNAFKLGTTRALYNKQGL